MKQDKWCYFWIVVVKEFIYFYINKFLPAKPKYYLIRVEDMKWPALEGFLIIQKKKKESL